ncbi:MAG: AMP-binding protein [Firmicutes bacterium]|nr:AMP-binding protein [Bacillota bacterium]
MKDPKDAWGLDVPGYWDPIEIMDPEERRNRIWETLKKQLTYVWNHSLFYRRKWEAVGFHIGDLKSWDDFERLPVTTKDEIRRDQEEYPPFGSNLCVGPGDIYHIHGTSGTTGRPNVFAWTKEDWSYMAKSHARAMWSFGLRPSDRVFIGSVFSLYIGAWGALAGVEQLGAQAFPFGAGQPGQTDRAIDWLMTLKPSAFYGTPSYAIYLAERARQRNIDPREFGLRILFFSGEPGAGIPETKRLIEDAFGGICVDTGSMAEATPWMSNAECEYRSGMHLWQDMVYTEVADPVHYRPVPFGQEGTVIYTHTFRRAQPMVRLLSGDLTCWTNTPCACGRTYPRLPKGIYGRLDDMVTVRGANIYPSQVESVIGEIPQLSHEFRIVVDREGPLDQVTIVAEAMPMGDKVVIERRLRERLKTVLGIRAEVQLLDYGELERTEFKARRVIDRRRR